MTQLFRLVHAQARAGAIQAIKQAREGDICKIGPPTRNLDQNAAQWPYIEAWVVNKQLCINGEMVNATKDDWKAVHTALYNGEARMAVHDGKVIMLPQRTSTMTKPVFSDWMEYLVAVTAQAGLEPVYKSLGAKQ